jgi:hypothetical protein
MRPAQQLAKVILLLILTTNKDANARARNPFSRQPHEARRRRRVMELPTDIRLRTSAFSLLVGLPSIDQLGASRRLGGRQAVLESTAQRFEEVAAQRQEEPAPPQLSARPTSLPPTR